MPGDTLNGSWVSPAEVTIGQGTAREAGAWAESQPGLTALVTGSRFNHLAEILEWSKEYQSQFLRMVQSGGEPDLDTLRNHVSRARQAGVTSVIGIGGGSVIDTAKAIAGLVPQPEDQDIGDFFEIIGRGISLPFRALPVMAIPTTAGTGAEATRNAVIGSSTHQVKVSLRHASMVPSRVILDPELTLSMPQHLTASTGLDAITQLIEALTTRRRNPFTDGICREGLALAARSFPVVLDQPRNLSARSDMLIAGYFSGLALANSGLGAVHGFAAPLGGIYKVPHGEVCAALLPAVLSCNWSQLDSLAASESQDLKTRYTFISRIFTGRDDASMEHLVGWLQSINRQSGIRPLIQMGINQDQWPSIIEKAMAASSMRGNPVGLARDSLHRILENASNP